MPLPTWLTGLGAKLLLAGAFVLVLLGAVFRLIGMGRTQERGVAAAKGMERTQQANAARAEAFKPVTPEVEANDPNNRDRN